MAQTNPTAPIPANTAFLPAQNTRFADNEFQNIVERTFRDLAADIDKHFVDVDKLNTNMVRGSVFRVPYIVYLNGVPSIDTSLIPPRFRILGMDAQATNGTDATTAAAGTRAAPMSFKLIADSTGPVVALVDELPTTTATVKARWVRTSGSDDEKIASYQVLPLEDQNVYKGEVYQHTFTDQVPAVTRLLEIIDDITVFSHPVPTGLDSDPYYKSFAPLTADTFTPLLATELNANKADYANLALHPLLIKLVNAQGAGGTTPAAPTAPAAPASFAIDAQGVGAFPLATSTAASDYEFELRTGAAPAAPASLTVDGQGFAQFPLAAGTSATDYEFETR
jgi:hypothetical protein